MNIGIFGGTFDPPHLGHLIVAESVQEQLDLGMVLFIPTYSPPHKADGAVAAPSHRLKMVQLAVADNASFKVSDIEVRRGGKSYTADTLRSLHALYRGDNLTLIIGSDNLRIFPSWKDPEEILRMCQVVVIDRPGIRRSVIEHPYVQKVRFVQVPNIEISGSDIRQRIQAGQSIRYLVTGSVRAYIDEHHLYG